MNERDESEEESESVLLYYCPTCGATHLDPVEDGELAALRQQLADRWTEIDGLNDQAAELHKKLAEKESDNRRLTRAFEIVSEGCRGRVGGAKGVCHPMTTEELAKLARKCASAVAKVEGPSSYYERLVPVLTAHLAAREAEYARLREAVEKHHRQRGNDKCWECDNELYVAFGLEPHSVADLPPIDEHRRNCEAYRCRLYDAALTPQQEPHA